MFIVLLRFSDEKDRAKQFLEGHKKWLQRGFDDGVFLLTGSLVPHQGGAIVAHGIALPALRERMNEDPFVSENVVTAEIIEVAPSEADERLHFLLERP